MTKGTSEEATDTTKLEEAVAESTAESATAEETKSQEAETKESKPTIPKARFDEVNNARKEAEAQVAAIEAKLEESTSSLNKLTEVLQAKEEDSELINSIRALAADNKMKPHVEAIDRKLRGIEDEVDEGKTSPEDAAKKTRELLNETRADLEDKLADQQANVLMTQADIIADKLLGALPEEYTEQDKDILARVWTPLMENEWGNVEEDPSQLSSILSTKFQEALDIFGVPRGGLASSETETDEETIPTETEPTAQEELKGILDTEWGAVKTVKDKAGRERSVAVLSDDDFGAAMAKAMKLANRQEP